MAGYSYSSQAMAQWILLAAKGGISSTAVISTNKQKLLKFVLFKCSFGSCVQTSLSNGFFLTLCKRNWTRIWGIGNRSAEVGKFQERLLKCRVFMPFNCSSGQKGKIFPTAMNKYCMFVTVYQHNFC